jgi:SH3-like domain-containing protein
LRLEARPLAVVQAEAVEVLAGPGRNHATLFTVHEGLTLEVRAERDGWLQIRLPNGWNGWVESGALTRV